MKRKVGRPAKRAAPRPAQVAVPEAGIDSDERIVERPDGYHWLSPDGRQEFGPFATREEAASDREAADEGDASEPGETLQEAEEELGIADWIDPDTGELAEGQSPPHLQDE
jgi:hypothetical protein